MLLLRLWKWRTTLDSPDTLRVLLAKFASITSESTVLGLPNIAWLSRFLQSERIFFNWSVITSPFAQYVFGVFCGVMPQFEPIRLRYTFNMCGFQIIHMEKQCTTYQCTYYNDTNKHSEYLRYLLTAPPNGQVWHKAFFMVGPGAGP